MKTMKTNQIWLSVLLAFAVGAGCAKQRPTEPDAVSKNVEGDFLDKGMLTGGTYPNGRDVSEKTWIGKVTVTSKSPNAGFAFVGYQSDVKAGHFEFSKDKLKFYSDSSIYPSDSQNLTKELVNEWTVTHHDVKLKESGGKVTNIEEEDQDKVWSDKRLFKINFADALISEASSFPYAVGIANLFDCFSKKASYLVDDSLDLSDDYLTFTVAVDYEQDLICALVNDAANIRRQARGDTTYTVHYKYSFKTMEESDFEPFVYDGINRQTSDLDKKYGYFYTWREKFAENTGLYQSVTLANRWDPRKEHNFYFAEDFPEEYKWMFADEKRGIFAKTNELFEKHGLPTRFNVRENTWGDGKAKKFGDIRYSFVKFVTELDYDAPLGYGPSDANPFTGEIFAANLIVWTGFLDYYVKRVSDHFERKDKEDLARARGAEESSLFVEMKKIIEQAELKRFSGANSNPSTWSNNFEVGSEPEVLMHKILPEQTYTYFGSLSEGRETADAFEQQGRDKLKSQLSGLSDILEKGAASHAMQDFKNTFADAEKHMKRRMLVPQHLRDTTVYPIDPVLSGVDAEVIKGKSADEIIKTIVYRTSIHELGHNLSLRHNFYGSVDTRNFKNQGKPYAARDSYGKVIKTEDGDLMIQAQSSSVMDYLDLNDELYLDMEWESYDEAALVYLYSDGARDVGNDHLYCTDGHRRFNALCNAYDVGSTPTQVLMSMIKRYDSRYFSTNYRNDRAYWNTLGYAGGIYGTMQDIKKFVSIGWNHSGDETILKKRIDELGLVENEPNPSAAKARYITPIKEDLEDAILLSILFYDAVIQQNSTDRPWSSERDAFSGEMERIGIGADKYFSQLFLFGNMEIAYDPNRPIFYNSYLLNYGSPRVGKLLDTVFENLLTERPDMRPGFISLGRALYAMTASNPANQDNVKLINNMRVGSYSVDQFADAFGIEESEVANTVGKVKIFNLNDADSPLQLNDPYYSKDFDRRIGVIEFLGRYYVASEQRNRFVWGIFEDVNVGNNLEDFDLEKVKDIVELSRLYRRVQ